MGRGQLAIRATCLGALVFLFALTNTASARESDEPLPRIWLYTLVSADYGGAALLPHFLEYYYNKNRIFYSRMLVNVHHNPEKYSREGLDTILGICSSYRVYCRVWEGAFSSEAHYNRSLTLLNDFVYDPDDWILVADSDEFQEYNGQSARAYLNRTERQGGTYVRGDLVDRVAPGGNLLGVTPSPSLDKQFPLKCHVVKNLYDGWDFKVVAFKAYLRTGRANHIIVRPDKARAYFGPCPNPDDCPRGRNMNLEEDWFDRTPYAQFKKKYRYKDSPSKAKGLWDAVEPKAGQTWKPRVTIYHYKWHEGVLLNMKDRADYYSGNCVLGQNEDNCTPLLLHWRESAKTYAAIKDSHRLDLGGMRCKGNTTATQLPSAASGQQGLTGGEGMARQAGSGTSGSEQHQLVLAVEQQQQLGKTSGAAGSAARQDSADMEDGEEGEVDGEAEEEEPEFEEPDDGSDEEDSEEDGETGEEDSEAGGAAAAAASAAEQEAAGQEGEGEEEAEEGREEMEEEEAAAAASAASEQAEAASRGAEVQGSGALQSAVETATGAVEVGAEQGGAQVEEADVVQAQVDAAVHGAVQSLLHGGQEAVQKALVEGDYQRRAEADKAGAKA